MSGGQWLYIDQNEVKMHCDVQRKMLQVSTAGSRTYQDAMQILYNGIYMIAILRFMGLEI